MRYPGPRSWARRADSSCHHSFICFVTALLSSLSNHHMRWRRCSDSFPSFLSVLYLQNAIRWDTLSSMESMRHSHSVCVWVYVVRVRLPFQCGSIEHTLPCQQAGRQAERQTGRAEEEHSSDADSLLGTLYGHTYIYIHTFLNSWICSILYNTWIIILLP